MPSQPAPHDQRLAQDALKHLHECEYEGGGAPATPESLAGALGCSRDQASDLLDSLSRQRLCDYSPDGARLSESGRAEARKVIRAHRLYETYLATRTGTPPAEWHSLADLAEHSVEADALATALGHPRFDPHGDPIPTRSGDLPALQGVPPAACQPPCAVKVLHVGDEPQAPAARLAAHGLAPGSLLRLDERLPDGSLRLTLEGRSLTLSPAEASLLRVQPLAGPESSAAAAVMPLSRLPEGRAATVSGLSPSCRGAERARLLDLGFVRGSRVEAVMSGPFGSPVAYRVRGALVALRVSQADAVLVIPEPEGGEAGA